MHLHIGESQDSGFALRTLRNDDLSSTTTQLLANKGSNQFWKKFQNADLRLAFWAPMGFKPGNFITAGINA